MSAQLTLTTGPAPARTPAPALGARKRAPSRPRPRPLAPVVNDRCTEHGIVVGPVTGLCRRCVGEPLLDAGWRPAHLMSEAEIAAYLAAHPVPERPQSGVTAGRVRS